MKLNDMEPSFARGLAVTLALYLTAFLIVWVPLIGPILALTFIPYISSAMGTRLADPKERVPLALSCSMIFSALETLIIVIVLDALSSATPMGFVMDSMGFLIFVLLWALNIIFGLLGAIRPWSDPFKEIEVDPTVK